MRVAQEHITHPHQSFRHLRVELDRFDGPRHRHPQLELTWIERGVGVRFIGDSAAPFTDGDLVLVGAQVPHAWVSSGSADLRPVAHVVQFPPALLELSLLPELMALRPLAGQACRGLAITGQAHRLVTARMLELAEDDSWQRLAALVFMLGALAAHPGDLSPVARAVPRPPDSAGSSSRNDRPIDRVIDWIAGHLSEDLTLEQAARVAHITPAAFSRFFRRETGRTWSDYVNDVRCSEACVRLRQSKQAITAVAHDCGYRTMSHFNREFRTRFGQSPREYRSG